MTCGGITQRGLWLVAQAAGAGTPYVMGCEIPNAAGRAAAIPLYGDRASWRTDYADGATHADDFAAGDSHHPVVTLGAGSDPALSLSGQELTLADVLTPAEHAAIDHSGYDATAIHENEAGEIHAIAEKETLEDDDVLLIEDSGRPMSKSVSRSSTSDGLRRRRRRGRRSGGLRGDDWRRVETQYTVEHSLDTLDVLVQVYDLTTTPIEKVEPHIQVIDENTVQVTFLDEPAEDQYRVMVVPVGEDSGGGGAFTGLTDTPASYAGQGGKYVAVKATEDGLEFL